MTDQKRFQYLLDRIRKLDAASAPYRFSVIALYDDPSTQPFQCSNKEKGSQRFEEAILSAVKSLKPDALRVEIFPNSSAEAPNETIEIRVSGKNATGEKLSGKPEKMSREAREKERSVIDKLDEYLARLNAVDQERNGLIAEKEALNKEKISLLGSLNDQNIEKIRHEHQLAMINFTNDLKIQEKDRLIHELEGEITDLQEQLQDALKIVDDYQARIEREGKLESSARDITALAKGALSVAPGLMKIANQFGLGGLATALADDPGPEQSLPASTDGEGMSGSEAENARFEKIQEIVQFCNNLSDSDLEGFLAITREFEKNPQTLKEFINLVKV